MGMGMGLATSGRWKNRHAAMGSPAAGAVPRRIAGEGMVAHPHLKSCRLRRLSEGAVAGRSRDEADKAIKLPSRELGRSRAPRKKDPGKHPATLLPPQAQARNGRAGRHKDRGIPLKRHVTHNGKSRSGNGDPQCSGAGRLPGGARPVRPGVGPKSRRAPTGLAGAPAGARPSQAADEIRAPDRRRSCGRPRARQDRKGHHARRRTCLTPAQTRSVPETAACRRAACRGRCTSRPLAGAACRLPAPPPGTRAACFCRSPCIFWAGGGAAFF